MNTTGNYAEQPESFILKSLRIEESTEKPDIELEDFFRGGVGETAKETDHLSAANNFMLRPLAAVEKIFDNGAI